MKISKRLKSICNLINDNSRVIDIGCDHAYLDIYLTLEKNIECVAADINKNALNIAKNNIEKNGLNIKTVLSDGVNNIDLFDDDIIILSGMGTKTILKILSNKKISNQKIIVQSNTEIFLLRKKLKKLGYCVVDEEVAFDNKKFYPTILYKKGTETRNCLIGNLIKKENGVVYVKYLIEKLEREYQKIPFSIRKIKVKRQIKFLKKTLSNYLRDN